MPGLRRVVAWFAHAGGYAGYGLAAVLVTAVVYHPIAAAYFNLDDFMNLQQIVNDPLLKYLLQVGSGHILVIRNAIFYLWFHAFGPRASCFFWAVLITHLLNVALLFDLIHALTNRARVACLGASLWGVSPLNEGTLGWYSVYGQTFTVTLLLVVLCRLARRIRLEQPLPFGEALAWYVILLIGAMTFGTGIGVALTFPAVVYLTLPGPRTTWSVRLLFASLPVVVLGLYAAVYRLSVTLAGGSYFSVIMLLALATYWHFAVGMLLNLVGFGVSALIGSFWWRDAYPGPLGYTVAALFAAALLYGLLSGPATTRRLVASLLIIGASSYAIIAVGRATMLASQSAFGATTPRYHYMGPVAFCVILCLELTRIAAWLRPGPGWRASAVPAWMALTLFLYARSSWTVDRHPGARRETETVLDAVAVAVDAAPPGEAVYISNRPFTSVDPLSNLSHAFAGWAGVYSIFYPDGDLGSRKVYFVEKDEAVLDSARKGRRLRDLVIPPEAQ